MKIAALSFYSAYDAFSGGRAGAHSSANQSYDVHRNGERRRKARVIEAARITPSSRLTTGLAMQVIAQLEKPDSPSANADRIEAARYAYRRILSASGELINFRA